MPDYSVLDELEEGVQLVSPEMRYLFLNRTLLAEIGMSLEELVGRRMEEKFPGIDTTEIYREIRRCHATGQSKKIINEFTFPDGHITYHELALQRVSDGVLIFSRDITATRKGELLLRETNKNLDHFAHVAAHDMGAPVRRMRILTEELLLDHEEGMAPRARQICQLLHAESTTLMRLIGDFRTLSGIGRTDLEREDVSLKQLIDAAVGPAAQRFAERAMGVQLPSEELIVSAYPSLLGLLLNNLVENALAHGEGTLEVRIEAGEQPPVVIFSNECSEEPLDDDVFLPFKSHHRGQHTGLGLTIAKKVIDYHRGRIWAEQSDGKFSIGFTLQPKADARTS